MDQSSAADHHFEPRVEDDALVRGLGRFVDDAPQPNQAYAAFVRSPHAHARIRSIDVAAARAAKGVVAVLTHKDIEAAGVGSTSLHPPLNGRNGTKLIVPFRPALAGERVLHVGQPVALVVAESAALAQDAAELVDGRVRGTGCGRRRARRARIRRAAALAGGARQCGDRLARPGAGRRQQRAARSRTSSPAPRMWRASRPSISASSSPRWSRAARPRGTTRRADHYTLRSCSQGAGPCAISSSP